MLATPFKRWISVWALAVWCSAWCVPPIANDEQPPEKGKHSLIEEAPSLYHTAKRYPKFYGDVNTAHGHFLERSYIVDDLSGDRDSLLDHGVYIDFGVTQFLQGNLSGGNDSSDARYNGSTDLWMWFDTGKAGWWSNGALFFHAEANWATSINGDVGSTLPANFDATLPGVSPPAQAAISELYYIHALPAHFLVAAGKMDSAAWADTNMFANKERTQFNYTGLVSNAIPGAFFPYTGIAAWADWSPNKHHNMVVVWSQADGSATDDSFDTLFNGDNTYAYQYIFSTEIAKKPGNFLFSAGYSSKDVPNFDGPPMAEASDNYMLIGNLGQYLWVDENSAETFRNRPHSAKARHDVPPLGVGIFARWGWAPDDRNVIDQFYSFGVGGYGLLMRGRDGDNWGLGWAGSHISGKLRESDSSFRSWEQALEVFYNFGLAPSVHLAVDAQIIRPAELALDTSYTLGGRIQFDF